MKNIFRNKSACILSIMDNVLKKKWGTQENIEPVEITHGVVTDISSGTILSVLKLTTEEKNVTPNDVLPSNAQDAT